MAKNSVRDFDATAANNTDIQSVNIAEGCAPSGINNAIRELMADMKDVSAGTIALESPQADSLTVTGDLTVDTNTLFVDASENKVGVGTTEISDGTLTILGKASGGVNGHCIQLGGDSGTGNQGGVLSFRQKGDSSQRATSWVGLAGFDNGSQRILYYGGGGWGIENATLHAFYTNASYDAGVGVSVERMRIDNSGNVLVGTTTSGGSGGVTLRNDGIMIAPAVYGTAVSASLRDIQMDSSGFFGYSTSTRATKGNIEDLSDVSWLYNLNPVSFNRKINGEELSPELEYGLIAEDVEEVNADLCFYNETDNGQELAGITYSKLITPLLKALQEANERIETLEAKVTTLESE